MSEEKQKAKLLDSSPITELTNPAELGDQILAAKQVEVAEAQLQSQLTAAEEKILKLEGEKHDLKERVEVHGIRKKYIGWLFALTVTWLIIVIIFLILNAVAKNFFSLSDAVLIAFITSTTVAVIGLFVIVARWLYPSPQQEERKQDK